MAMIGRRACIGVCLTSESVSCATGDGAVSEVRLSEHGHRPGLALAQVLRQASVPVRSQAIVLIGNPWVQVRRVRAIPRVAGENEQRSIVALAADRLFLRTSSGLRTSSVLWDSADEGQAAAFQADIVDEIEEVLRSHRIASIAFLPGQLLTQPSATEALRQRVDHPLAYLPVRADRTGHGHLVIAVATLLLCTLAAVASPGLAALKVESAARKDLASLASDSTRSGVLSGERLRERTINDAVRLAATHRSPIHLLATLATALPPSDKVLEARMDSSGGTVTLLSADGRASLMALAAVPALGRVEIRGDVARGTPNSHDRLTVRFSWKPGR